MTPYDFVRIAGEPNLELALDGVFQEAHAKWTDENIEADGNDEQWTDERTLACLTQGQITVLVVETYFGEVLNGGHYQYFSNESGGFANFAPAALRRVNLDEFATVVESFIALFPDARVPVESEERQEVLDQIADSHDDELFDRLEAQFDKLHPGGFDYYRKKLFAYVLAHEDQFVS